MAIKRFDETRKSSGPLMGYRSIISVFVPQGNTVNDYDIRELASSPFAIPLARTREVRGETSMRWTAFAATMCDPAIARGTTRSR